MSSGHGSWDRSIIGKNDENVHSYCFFTVLMPIWCLEVKLSVKYLRARKIIYIFYI